MTIPPDKGAAANPEDQQKATYSERVKSNIRYDQRLKRNWKSLLRSSPVILIHRLTMKMLPEYVSLKGLTLLIKLKVTPFITKERVVY